VGENAGRDLFVSTDVCKTERKPVKGARILRSILDRFSPVDVFSRCTIDQATVDRRPGGEEKSSLGAATPARASFYVWIVFELHYPAICRTK
jgi:hypothetical protein